MILAYIPRLICLVLACFFLIYTGAALGVALYSGPAIRAARGFRARSAERFLLALRLLPFTLAAMAAPGLVLPSYLWFEPEPVDERVGILCLALSALGATILCVATARALKAALRSQRFALRSGGTGDGSVLVIESEMPFLALAGIVRPRVIVSRRVADALSTEQFRVVLRHELAHRDSHDNLKRLLISFIPGLRALEKAWARFAEYAADDEAVAGNELLSLALASALVRVARFGGMQAVSAVSTSFLGDTGELTARVDRLLRPQQTTSAVQWPGAGSALLLGLIGALVFRPQTLRSVQSLLEGLVR